MRIDGNVAFIEPGDWKNTRIKERDFYACIPPIGTKVSGGETAGDSMLQEYRYDIKITDKDFRVVLSDGGGDFILWTMAAFASMCKFADGSPVTQGSITAKMVKAKVDGKGAMPWARVTVKTGNEELLAVKLDSKIQTVVIGVQQMNVGAATNDINGKVLVCEGHDGVMRGTPKVIGGTVFAKSYNLNAFPNVFKVSSFTCEMPAPLFEIAHASDMSVTKEKVDEMLVALKEKAPVKVEVACIKFEDKYIASVIANGKSIKIFYGEKDGLDLEKGLARNFEVFDPSTQRTIKDSAELLGVAVAEETISIAKLVTACLGK